MWRRNELGLVLFGFALLPSSVYSALLVPLLAYLIGRVRGRVPVGALLPIAPLVLMIASGLVFSQGNDARDALKDVWYVGKIVLIAEAGILMGYTSAPNTRWLEAALRWGCLAVVFRLAQYAATMEQSSEVGVPLGPVLLAPFALRYLATRTGRAIFAAPILLATLISNSRTSIVLLILAWLGARGTFRSGRKLVLAIGALIIVAELASPLLPQYDINNITFLGKVHNSLDELAFERGQNLADISANWRGFEAYKAFEMWQSSSLGEKIFGQGLGTLIDIGFYFDLGGDYSVRYLPILHNAYFTVLVKFGVLGLLLFLIFMTLPLRLSACPSDSSRVMLDRLGSTAAIVLVVTTLTISGPLNLAAADGVTLLWGLAIGMHLRHRVRLKRAPQPYHLALDDTRRTIFQACENRLGGPTE
jgi:hypothetical protein